MFKLVIKNAEAQLYIREYAELPQYTTMFNKIAKSKTQEIRFKCSYDEPIPAHIIREMALRLEIKTQYKQMTDEELELQNTLDHRSDRNIILTVEKKRRLKMATKKTTKEVTPPMAQLEQVIADPTNDYQDIPPVRLYFIEYKRFNDNWFKLEHAYKEFNCVEDVHIWARRHILAKAKSKPITIETVGDDFTIITIHGLRNYTKSVRV